MDSGLVVAHLAHVLEFIINPIARESGPGDNVSLNAPFGGPFLISLMCRSNPKRRSRSESERCG